MVRCDMTIGNSGILVLHYATLISAVHITSRTLGSNHHDFSINWLEGSSRDQKSFPPSLKNSKKLCE